MNLSARQLRAFLALVEERHFTRAAARCHLSQPAFSAVIRSLEEDARVRLFDRSTRHVELTVEGELFEPHVRALLADMAFAMEGLHDHAARRRGRVAVATLPSLAAGWLPMLMAKFQKEYSGISLQLHDALQGPCLDLVVRGEADFAIAALRADMSDLEGEFLFADEFFLVCPENHPLAAREQIGLKDVLKWPWIALAGHSSVRKHLDKTLGEGAPAPVQEVEHLATVAGLVLAGIGVTLVPAMTLFHFDRPGLVIKPIASKLPARQLFLVRKKGRSLSVAAQTFYDLLLTHTPEPYSRSRRTPSGDSSRTPSILAE